MLENVGKGVKIFIIILTEGVPKQLFSHTFVKRMAHSNFRERFNHLQPGQVDEFKHISGMIHLTVSIGNASKVQ